MRLFQRLFGATREAITLPNCDGSSAVKISATMLRECIDRGSAGTDGPNRARLATPFARGYLFGFSDTCIQRFAVFDELESLALITVVHGALFGEKIGPLLVHDALRDQRDAEFVRGRTAGAEDHLRWLNDRTYCPRSLTDYLLEDSAPASLIAPKVEPPAESAIGPSNILTRRAPSRWNNALVRRRAIAEATPDKSATIIQLHTRTHIKAIKPTEH
jgi:hypothetical protein